MENIKKIVASLLLLLTFSVANEIKIMTEILSPYQFRDEIDGKL